MLDAGKAVPSADEGEPAWRRRSRPRGSRDITVPIGSPRICAVSYEVGTIASGKSADVIAVGSSPLDDVSVLQRVAFVMARGDVHLGVT